MIHSMFVAHNPTVFADSIAEKVAALPEALRRGVWVWAKKTDPDDADDFQFDYGTSEHEWRKLRGFLGNSQLRVYIGTKGIKNNRQVNLVLRTYAGFCDGIGFDFASGWSDTDPYHGYVAEVCDHAAACFGDVHVEANHEREWSMQLARKWGNVGMIAAPNLWRSANANINRERLSFLGAHTAGFRPSVVISRRPMVAGIDGEPEPMSDADFSTWKVEQVLWAHERNMDVILNPARLLPDQIARIVEIAVASDNAHTEAKQ